MTKKIDIEKIIAEAVDYMELNHWVIVVKKELYPGEGMKIKIKPEYYEAVLYVENPDYSEESTQTDPEVFYHMVCHELGHIYCKGLAVLAESVDESRADYEHEKLAEKIGRLAAKGLGYNISGIEHD